MTYTKKTLRILFLLLLTSLLKPIFAYSVNIEQTYPLAKNWKPLGTYVTYLTRAAVLGAGVITFLLIIGGGIGMIASAGNAQQQEKSKSAVTAGVMGLALVIGAYWILQILSLFTGIDLLNPGI